MRRALPLLLLLTACADRPAEVSTLHGLRTDGGAVVPWGVHGAHDALYVLEDCLIDCPGEALPEQAARSLGDEGSLQARAILLRALRWPRRPTVTAAIVGLARTDNPAACDDLASVLSHPDPVVRYRAIRASSALSCLDPSALQSLARGEPDFEVRALLRTLRGPG